VVLGLTLHARSECNLEPAPVTHRFKLRSYLCSLLGVFLFAATAMAQAAPSELVFSVKRWEGEYQSKDIPGGVESTPWRGSIYKIGLDGSAPTKVIELGASTDYPFFSVDGRWIYFQSNPLGYYQIYRCRPDGTGVENLTAGDRLGEAWKSAFGYALSRDGTQMLYTVHDGKIGQVVMAGADGAEPRRIAPKLGYIYMAALSPSNDRVVFSGPASGYRLLIVDLPDGEPRKLTPDHPESFAPQFTPDGKTILFTRRDGDLYRVDADGQNLRRLTEGNNYVEFKLSASDHHGSTDGPAISPDGKSVAYISRKDGVPNVYAMGLDGDGQRQITTRQAPCGRVRWSPDGRQLSFVSFEGRYPQLFVVDATGGMPHQLTNLDGAVNFVQWRPAGAAE